MTRYKQIPVTVAVLGTLLLSACGGGGSSSGQAPQPPPPSLPAKAMIWKAPQYFTDNSALDPATDLQRFEIYVRQDDPSFGPADSAIATASPGDTTFNLATLVPPLSKGVTYYVSVRVVTMEDEISDFSPAFSFSFPN